MRRCAFRIAELSVTVRSHSAHVPCPRGLTVGYYAWKARPEPVHGAVTRGRAAKIQVIHRKSREAYGSPSIWDALVKQGALFASTASRASCVPKGSGPRP